MEGMFPAMNSFLRLLLNKNKMNLKLWVRGSVFNVGILCTEYSNHLNTGLLVSGIQMVLVHRYQNNHQKEFPECQD